MDQKGRTYEETYEEPFRAFRFLVKVNEGVVAAFSQFSGVKMDMETLQVRSGNDIRGVQETVPVFTKFAPVTLTKGVVRNNAFLDWLFSAAAGPYAGPSGKKEELYRTLDIVALDDWGNPGVIWSLIDAFPIGYELSPMDGGRSEVLSERLTFTISGMERTVQDPVPIEEIERQRLEQRRRTTARPPVQRTGRGVL